MGRPGLPDPSWYESHLWSLKNTNAWLIPSRLGGGNLCTGVSLHSLGTGVAARHTEMSPHWLLSDKSQCPGAARPWRGERERVLANAAGPEE